jgi:cyclase
MPLTYGGGVRTLQHTRELFASGVEKVALNTSAHERPELIAEIAGSYGSQAVVVSMDVKKGFLGKYQVYVRGGRQNTGMHPVDYAQRAERMGAGEILLTSIDRDGTMRGYDVDLISQVSRAVRVPVIACGGAGKLIDFVQAVKEGGASAVAAGSMVVYQGDNRAVLINFPVRKDLRALLS